MGKDTNSIGQPVLSQLLKLMNRDKINTLAKKSGANHYTKRLDAYTHLVIMLYAVISHFDSIREVTLGFKSHISRLNHLGINYIVRRSTLSDANKRRASSFFGEVYAMLYKQYEQLLSDSRLKKEIFLRLYILDSTTISLFKEILKGAGRNPKIGKKKGGIKAHTVIKGDGSLPLFVDYTASAVSDRRKMGRLLELPSGSYVVFDKGYYDYYEWQLLTDADITFVTRLKDNAKVVVKNALRPKGGNIVSDEIIELSYNQKVKRQLTAEEMKHRRGRRPKSGIAEVTIYRKGVVTLRRIVKLTDDGKGTIAFVTNDMTHRSEEICEIYRRRWAIETLFKLLKQNFPLKYFLGDNVNAIEIQIWVTMIAYLLTKVIAKKSQSKLAFSSIVTTIRITLTEYIDIINLLNDPDKSMLRWELAEAERAAGEQNSLQLELFGTP
jgi:hypothetical protein